MLPLLNKMLLLLKCTANVNLRGSLYLYSGEQIFFRKNVVRRAVRYFTPMKKNRFLAYIALHSSSRALYIKH